MVSNTEKITIVNPEQHSILDSHFGLLGVASVP